MKLDRCPMCWQKGYVDLGDKPLQHTEPCLKCSGHGWLSDGKGIDPNEAIRLAVAAAYKKAIEAVKDAGGDNEDYHANAIRTLVADTENTGGAG